MDNNSNIDDRPFRIPPVVWALGAVLIATLIAIFVFKASVNTVASYAFFAFMLGSHFFMHRSHRGHGGSAGHQHDAASNAAESEKNEHAGHTGGCH